MISLMSLLAQSLMCSMTHSQADFRVERLTHRQTDGLMILLMSSLADFRVEQHYLADFRVEWLTH
jgi:hypothetical protein